MKKLLFLLAISFCLTASAQKKVIDSKTTFAREALQPYVDSGELPGAISIFYADGVQETCCIGYANVEQKRPIRLDNVYMQCSQTKGFCGVTIAKLVEEGKLSLDDPVSKYLPEFSELWVQDSDKDGIRTLQADIALGDGDLTQPIVRYEDDTLAAVIERANAICQSSIPLRIAGRDAGAIDINLVKHWLYTNENCELLVNVDNVREWTQGALSRQFDAVGSERTYTRADGKQVTVTGGDYGWSLDGEALADLIAQNLQADDVGPIDAPMKSTAVEWNPGGADWGKRYIDVDMTEQHVRVYGDDGQIVIESDCVTGIPAHATDEGVYTIYEHTPNTTLVGLDYNNDGKPDYETPVSYWMPFNGGQGLHDAYWRYSFGGEIWQYDGSHGCVNLPSDIAAQLFDWSHVGDVVVVHW